VDTSQKLGLCNIVKKTVVELNSSSFVIFASVVIAMYDNGCLFDGLSNFITHLGASPREDWDESTNST
jgi:hypothetical protein